LSYLLLADRIDGRPYAAAVLRSSSVVLTLCIVAKR